jgi:hypothetical protein
MRKNLNSSTAAPTPHERALLLQVTALQFEKSALSLELKTLKEQQEAFLNEVENEIETQKSEGLAAAAAEIQILQLQRRQATEAAAREINQLQLQLKQTSSNHVPCGDSRTSEDFAALELRLAVALEASSDLTQSNVQLKKELETASAANISLTQANVQLRNELIDALSCTQQQTIINTSNPSVSYDSSQVNFDSQSLALQSLTSVDVHESDVNVTSGTSLAHDEVMSHNRFENFRGIILRNFCYRIAHASSYRAFRRWNFFVKDQVHKSLHKTLEVELLELTHIHRAQQLEIDNFQALGQQAISSIWRFSEILGNSKILASSRKALRSMWRCWIRRIRIRRRVQIYALRNWKKCFISWIRSTRHHRLLQRMLFNLLQRKKRILSQKIISLWRHEALSCHITEQHHQVQQAAEKFITMHEAQNDAVSAIKQTCSQMMTDLESVTSDRNRFLNLFLLCEGKLLALVCIFRANSSLRLLFQIWKRKLANRKNVIRIQKRLARDFIKRTLLLWYFDSKIRVLNDFHERQISESIENLELERETTGAALLNTEDQLVQALSHLDEAIIEIEHLRRINHRLSCSISDKSSQTKDRDVQTNALPTFQDNEAQTEAESGPSFAMAVRRLETKDNDAQTEPVLNSI